MSLYEKPLNMHTCSENSCKKKWMHETIQRQNTEYMFIVCHMHNWCGKRIVRQMIVYRSHVRNNASVCTIKFLYYV